MRQLAGWHRGHRSLASPPAVAAAAAAVGGSAGEFDAGVLVDVGCLDM